MAKQPPRDFTINEPRTPASGTLGSQEWLYKIGDLAREFDVTLRTLRFYEDRGLVTPKREGTTRYYTDEDRERLRVALFGKRIGLSLGQISQVLGLLETPDETKAASSEIKSIYEQQLAVLSQRIEDTQNAMDELKRAIASL
ncbi:MAG: MerR family transcriptional regulator [Pseudomonadota bacterium]